ncbi:mitochondrial carrier domain-containing protein [Suillus spraguei]|nr:mitochondrial carrier domain-containing protein [Suillus spraguei]
MDLPYQVPGQILDALGESMAMQGVFGTNFGHPAPVPQGGPASTSALPVSDVKAGDTGKLSKTMVLSLIEGLNRHIIELENLDGTCECFEQRLRELDGSVQQHIAVAVKSFERAQVAKDVDSADEGSSSDSDGDMDLVGASLEAYSDRALLAVPGGLAGTAVDLLFFPIDTVKTRLQSAQGFINAGGFRGIYKGVGSVVVGSAPGAAAFFSTYEAMKHSIPLHGQLAPVNHMLSASVAEAACLIRVPTEVIKTGTQTSMYGASASSFKAATLVLEHDGIRGFYRGFWTTIMREIPFTSLQFPLYEFLKHRLSIYLDRKPLYAHEAAVCGSIAGGTAAALTTPLDVLKTRVMLDLRDPSKQQVPSLLMRVR